MATSAPTAIHLIDTGGPGGAETVFCELASRLDGRPLRSIAVVPRTGWLSTELEKRGVLRYIIDSRGSMNIRYLRSLIALARDADARLIHAHLLGSAVYASMVGILLKLPVVSVFHGPTDLKSLGRFPAFKRWLLERGSARLVAVSESTRESLEQFGVAPSRIELVTNGVDTSAYAPCADTELRIELGLGRDDVLIGAVGNIRPAKSYETLLHAAKLLFDRSARVQVAVVGEGSADALAPLYDLRESLGIAHRFHFLGFRKTTKALLANLDVFVSSSRTEGLPLSFLEAMACGVCMVATRSGGAQEVIETERSGLLVPIENPAALANALERVVRDAELRRRLAAAGMARVQSDFSLDATLERYESMYRETLAGPRARKKNAS